MNFNCLQKYILLLSAGAAHRARTVRFSNFLKTSGQTHSGSLDKYILICVKCICLENRMYLSRDDPASPGWGAWNLLAKYFCRILAALITLDFPYYRMLSRPAARTQFFGRNYSPLGIFSNDHPWPPLKMFFYVECMMQIISMMLTRCG